MAFRPSAHGPDVARYQHVVDEAAVPEWGLASCKLGEGRSYFDQTSPKWIALFRRKRVRCLGVYFWIRGDTPVDVQFVNFATRLQQVGLADGKDLDRGVLLQLDWETTPNVRNVSVAEIEQFIYLCHVRYGDRLITYVSDWVPGFHEWRRKHPTAPLWYANYNLGTGATGGLAECEKYGATVWQWTSSYKGGGIASGTPGRPETDTGYDMNHVFDWAVLDRLCLNGSHVDKPSEIEKPPVVVLPPTPIPEGDDDMQYRVNEHWFGEGDAGAPGKVHFELVRDHTGRLRYLVLTDAEWTALNQPTATKIANETLLALGPWQPPAPSSAATSAPNYRAIIGAQSITLTPVGD